MKLPHLSKGVSRGHNSRYVSLDIGYSNGDHQIIPQASGDLLDRSIWDDAKEFFGYGMKKIGGGSCGAGCGIVGAGAGFACALSGGGPLCGPFTAGATAGCVAVSC